MTQKIYQKQFSISEIFSESWKRFIENFRLILIITLIVYIPINILLAFIPVGDSLESLRIYYKILRIIDNLFGVIATMAIVYVIKNKIDGKTISVGQALKKSFSKWGAVIGTNIMAGIFAFGLMLLLIVPGIIYSVYWIFAVYVVLLNDKSGKKALDYSKEIVKGRWWRVTGYYIVFGILGFIVGVIYSFPFLFFLDENLLENLFISVVSDTFSDIISSFFVVVSAIFFINFEATKKTEMV